MSLLSEYVEKAVFYSQARPEMLAGIILSLSNPYNISDNISIGGVSVPNGTALSSVKSGLPTKYSLVTDKGIPFDFDIVWGDSTSPAYDDDLAGDYTISGTISGLPSFVTNTGNKVVTCKITVLAAEE